MFTIVLFNCFTKLFLSYLFDEPKKYLFLTNSKLMLLGKFYLIPTYKYSIFISFFALLKLTIYKFYLLHSCWERCKITNCHLFWWLTYFKIFPFISLSLSEYCFTNQPHTFSTMPVLLNNVLPYQFWLQLSLTLHEAKDIFLLFLFFILKYRKPFSFSSLSNSWFCKTASYSMIVVYLHYMNSFSFIVDLRLFGPRLSFFNVHAKK